MKLKGIFLITAFLSLLAEASATTQCNLLNFGMNGAQHCGIKFVNSTYLTQRVPFNPNASTIVSNALKEFGISLIEVNQQIAQVFPNLDIPKIIELGLAVEPYVSYVIGDIIQGFGLTTSDLAKLKLPGMLAEMGNLMSFYESYFKHSCGQDVVRPLISCINDWMTANCDPVKDKTAVISNYLNTMANYYCDDSKGLKASIKTKLDGDFGTVYAGVAKYFGIYKDASNQFLFNISQTSLFMNQTALQVLAEMWISKCQFSIDSLIPEISSIITENSAVGVGEVIERILSMSRALTSCTLRVWNEFDGSFMKSHAKFIDHLQFLVKRYGLPELSWNRTNLGDERATVVVYGDPHMITYKSRKAVTCSAAGESIYLANSLFELRGNATPACELCDATYVTQVHIKFQKNISYSSSDTLSTNLTNNHPSGNITIENLGGSVRITDMNSGAVFLLAKYRHTYMITVRMAVDLFENSMGLLINGCPQTINITAPAEPRQKRSTCLQACSAAPEEFKETCLYDCRVTGDIEVVKISQQTRTLQEKVTEADTRIMSALNINPPPTGEGTTTIGSMFLIISVTVFNFIL